MSDEDKFQAAVNVIRNLPKNGSYQPSHELQLRFYGYYKQATCGPNRSPKPSFWEVTARAKWEAWNRLGSMPRQAAMQAYVKELNQIVETMAYTDNVADFLSSLDSFYVNVPPEELEMCIGPTLEKVRSQPGSPLATTPLGSRDTSPRRDRKSPGLEQDDDEEEEDFLDSVDVTASAATQSPVGELEVRKPVVKLANGHIPNGKINHIVSDPVGESLERTLENMRRDLAQTKETVRRLEQELARRRKKPRILLTPTMVGLLVAWPVVSHLLLHWFLSQRRKAP